MCIINYYRFYCESFQEHQKEVLLDNCGCSCGYIIITLIEWSYTIFLLIDNNWQITLVSLEQMIEAISLFELNKHLIPNQTLHFLLAMIILDLLVYLHFRIICPLGIQQQFHLTILYMEPNPSKGQVYLA